ncbi:Rv3654c family TadE-like protein [Bifidobacterium myosotis]|nr:Rv3654c family TadE-like protein [Bifidobacterium myosotis]
MMMRRLDSLEEGSGTMAGVIVVLMAGVALAVVASVSNLLICQQQARALADLTAFSAAYAAWHGNAADPCALALDTAMANDAMLADCVTEEDDVWVAVAVATKVPIAPSVEYRARAGPVDCREGEV